MAGLVATNTFLRIIIFIAIKTLFPIRGVLVIFYSSYFVLNDCTLSKYIEINFFKTEKVEVVMKILPKIK